MTSVQGHPTTPEVLGWDAGTARSAPHPPAAPRHPHPLPSDIVADLRAEAAQEWRDEDAAYDMDTRTYPYTDGTDL